jgi:Zn-dependent M28 family amino/carboxypeptidase
MVLLFPFLDLSAQELTAHDRHVLNQFQGTQAFSFLQKYVHKGHRYYGAPLRSQVIQSLKIDLSQTGFEVSSHQFPVVEAQSKKKYTLTNIIGRFNPQNPQRVILATHWDTRLWAEEDADSTKHDQPITGANDGTSGLAVLLEMARVISKNQADFEHIGIDIIFFDGEEFGRPKSDQYCKGSRFFVKNLAAFYPQAPPQAVIVIDMVGDRDLTFPPERSSFTHAPQLTKRVWKEAYRLKAPAFKVNQMGPWIVDDHTPFQEIKIPALLLIDYQYPHWHTHQDTLDRCSPDSLHQVGQVLLSSLLHFK